MLLRSQGRHVQHLQKALTQMNIQLANVISGIAGETGQKILRAIVAGERFRRHAASIFAMTARTACLDDLSVSFIATKRPS